MSYARLAYSLGQAHAWEKFSNFSPVPPGKPQPVKPPTPATVPTAPKPATLAPQINRAAVPPPAMAAKPATATPSMGLSTNPVTQTGQLPGKPAAVAATAASAGQANVIAQHGGGK